VQECRELHERHIAPVFARGEGSRHLRRVCTLPARVNSVRQCRHYCMRSARRRIRTAAPGG
jgi:hypothetical protein